MKHTEEFKKRMSKRQKGKNNSNWKGGFPNCAVCGKKLGDRRSTYCPNHQISGKKHPLWKGDDVGYEALHTWIRNRKKKPKYCGHCGENKPLDLSNISGEYKRSIEDYEYICRKCHMIKDGTIDNWKKIGKEWTDQWAVSRC